MDVGEMKDGRKEGIIATVTHSLLHVTVVV